MRWLVKASAWSCVAVGLMSAFQAAPAAAQCKNCGKPRDVAPPASIMLLHDEFADKWADKITAPKAAPAPQDVVGQPFSTGGTSGHGPDHNYVPTQPADGAVDGEAAKKNLMPKYHFSGNNLPYYYGRSFQTYPHYQRWYTPATEARYDNHQATRPYRPYKWGLFNGF